MRSIAFFTPVLTTSYLSEVTSMNVTIEELSSVKKKLLFEVPVERVDEEIKKAYDKIAKSAKVKGFRPGKVPRPLLERQYEPHMQEEVLSRLINDSYFKALTEHKIDTVSDPQIVDSSVVAKGQPFSFEAHVEVLPQIEAKEYTKLALKKEKLELDASIPEGRLEELRASRAEMKVSERDTAKGGDFVTIDFEGFLDGVAFDGGKGTDHVLELGSGSFIPGFEEQVDGMKRGEEKEINVTFPEAYGNADLAGKPTTFKVALKEIKEKVLPEADDDFAKGFGMESIAALKEDLEKSYREREEHRVEEELRERLMTALIERNPVEVPESMVARQLDYMLENIRRRFQSQGMSLEMLGMNDDSFRAMYRDSAVKQVQGSLLLSAISTQEKVGVEVEEIDAKLEKIAEMANAPLEAVKEHYAAPEAKQGLVAQIIEEKVMEFLLKEAAIEEVAKEELNPQEDADDSDKE